MSDTTDVVQGFRYPKPTREDLPRLARLAYDLSAVHCGACRDYHVMWPYLRSLGCNGGGPEYCWPIQTATLAEAIADRSSVRWLLAGSADAGQLALVGETIAASPTVEQTVTVVDRCETPLGLCRAHAQAAGLRVSTANADLEHFKPDGEFDVALLHHLITHFPPEKRAALVARVAGWLAPGGRILLTGSYRPSGRPVVSMSHALRAWRERIFRSDAASGAFEPPEDLEAFVARLDGIRRDGVKSPSLDHGDYSRLFAAAGVSVLKIVDLPFDASETALYGGSPAPRCIFVLTRP